MAYAPVDPTVITLGQRVRKVLLRAQFNIIAENFVILESLLNQQSNTSWYIVYEQPNSVLGVDGDLALNPITGDLYQKDNGEWALVGNLRGPPGISYVLSVNNQTGDVVLSMNEIEPTPERTFLPPWRKLLAGSGVVVTPDAPLFGEDSTIAADYATPEEAEAGENAVKVMTPVLTAAAMAAQMGAYPLQGDQDGGGKTVFNIQQRVLEAEEEPRAFTIADSGCIIPYTGNGDTWNIGPLVDTAGTLAAITLINIGTGDIVLNPVSVTLNGPASIPPGSILALLFFHVDATSYCFSRYS